MLYTRFSRIRSARLVSAEAKAKSRRGFTRILLSLRGVYPRSNLSVGKQREDCFASSAFGETSLAMTKARGTRDTRGTRGTFI